MRPSSSPPRRTHRVSASLVALALAVLALGAVAHTLHHLGDPDCDSGRTPSSHPCVSCSGFHKGLVAAETDGDVPFVPTWAHEYSVGESPSPASTTPPRYAPRAPPIA